MLLLNSIGKQMDFLEVFLDFLDVFLELRVIDESIFPFGHKLPFKLLCELHHSFFFSLEVLTLKNSKEEMKKESVFGL